MPEVCWLFGMPVVSAETFGSFCAPSAGVFFWRWGFDVSFAGGIAVFGIFGICGIICSIDSLIHHIQNNGIVE